MNSEIHQQQGGNNGVVFLIAAIFNALLTMTYQPLTEYALYALVGNAIAAIVWLLFKRLNDRMERKATNRINKYRTTMRNRRRK